MQNRVYLASRPPLQTKQRRSLMISRSLSAWLSYCSLLLTGGIPSFAEDPAEKPLEVAVVRPLVKELTDHEDFTGRTEASNRVELRARASGYLVRVNFRDGAEVKRDD